MKRAIAIAFVLALYGIGAAFDIQIDDGAQVIADDKTEAINAAKVASKE